MTSGCGRTLRQWGAVWDWPVDNIQTSWSHLLHLVHIILYVIQDRGSNFTVASLYVFLFYNLSEFKQSSALIPLKQS